MAHNRRMGDKDKLKQKRFRLDIRKNFIIRMVKHLNRSPKEVVSSPFLEVKIRLDKTLSNVTCSHS